MTEATTWFRVDRKTAKWHMTRTVVPGELSMNVYLGVCGAGVGGSPEREPAILITETEPPAANTCSRCRKRGSHHA